MEQLIAWISQPWPWYVAGPLIGLTVPVLLLVGNKSFGISSSLRHVCAMCVPANIPFFTYNWKKEMWNIIFVLGVLVGGFLATTFLSNPDTIVVAESTQADLAALGITDYSKLMPAEIFNWENLFTAKGLLFFVIGGFMVGFGTRYAGGCTSGHAIMGISSLQWPSLVATIFFMIGGFLMTHVLLGPLMKLVGF
ncbi:YeeE/YedE family protein [Belliella kenyensis]|uniref:YeeE/YedE family protein n=2 Tax=Belliella TaxID=232244 RepID=A0ABS9V4B1_9BACT|nr:MULTISPECIES: YeeE/YedE thiosulfate transporter family protein [Belliella]MCH7402444.1 YeeE/YedE family protein [Belliella kenyensis]MCH7410813.1 YeeE/YedE family protein [Belliella filtrata]MDN3603635.1 YeeE/YedE thiosulfate transporter family protein [Belliella kenyensis]